MGLLASSTQVKKRGKANWIRISTMVRSPSATRSRAFPNIRMQSQHTQSSSTARRTALIINGRVHSVAAIRKTLSGPLLRKSSKPPAPNPTAKGMKIRTLASLG